MEVINRNDSYIIRACELCFILCEKDLHKLFDMRGISVSRNITESQQHKLCHSYPLTDQARKTVSASVISMSVDLIITVGYEDDTSYKTLAFDLREGKQLVPLAHVPIIYTYI